MDKLVSEGQWWWLFVVPVAAGFFALLGSWIGSRLGKVTEHQQWLRNHKIESYTNLLRQAHASINSLDAHQHDVAPRENRLEGIEDVTNARLAIVGSREVRTWAVVHHDNLRRAFNAVKSDEYPTMRTNLKVSESRLEEAIRDDLDVIEKQVARQTVRAWLYEHLVYPWRDPLERRFYRKHGYAWVDRKNHRR